VAHLIWPIGRLAIWPFDLAIYGKMAQQWRDGQMARWPNGEMAKWRDGQISFRIYQLSATIMSGKLSHHFFSGI
jgi:hypothetical protein